MPQLDIVILQSQLNFFIVFFFGYFFFLKYILPIISFFLKMKYKLVISNLIWLKENSDFFIFYRKSFLLPFLKFSFLFQLVDFFKNNNFIFFNLYPFDFFYVRSIYKK